MSPLHRTLGLALPLLAANAAAVETPLGIAAPAAQAAALRDRLPSPARRANGGDLGRAIMLEGQFRPAHGMSDIDRAHAVMLPVGGIDLTAETMRLLVPSGGGAGDRRPRVLDRRYAIGLRADRPLGPDDRLFFGLAANRERRVEPAILAARKHVTGSAYAAELGWAHGRRFHLALGWHVDRGDSEGGGIERLVELAQGAPLNARGLRFALDYALPGGDASRGAVLGFMAGRARIAAADRALLGIGRAQDARAALFFRNSF